MGMYDTLNGERVKCFPWFSFYVSPNDDTKCCITNHDGNLGEYGNGNEIPYRSLAYNYGKDFLIFDFNPKLVTNEIGNWVAHMIETLANFFPSLSARAAAHFGCMVGRYFLVMPKTRWNISLNDWQDRAVFSWWICM